MAEMNQFGSVPPGSAQVCGRCEALLMDVQDGTASAGDQSFFDGHVASCTGCSQMLEDARRGGAWLEMLRDPRPEPPAALFERILAQTSGLEVSAGAAGNVVEIGRAGGANLQGQNSLGVALTGGAAVGMAGGAGYAPAGVKPVQYGSVLKVLPFRMRGTLHSLSQTVLQPRLAMTAAMAFFSIALTLNLTGVRVSELRVSDLRPANLRRDFYEANAHVVRYCDNLRVVYELEARAHDLQRSSDSDSSPSTRDDGQGSGSKEPAGGAQQGDKPAAPKAAPKPGPGTSRREPLVQDNRLVAALPGSNDDQGALTVSSVDDARCPRGTHLKGDQA